jgi:sugar phosphate isomerase/epimerase
MRTRRFLFIQSIAVIASLCSLTMVSSARAETAIPKSTIPAEARINGVAVSVQSWSFNRFTALEAIEKVAATGAKCIELFPGQKLSATSDVGVGPDMKPEDMKILKDQLAKFGLRATAFGVTGVPQDEEGAKKLFTFAKELGITCINTESTESVDTIEKMVKQFDIRVGFHNHPKRADDPNYKVWDPNYILQLVKGRDPRVGACADTGHWVRTGIDPVEALKILEGRIVSSHFKDLHEKGGSGHDVPWGTGISNAAAQLKQLRSSGFDGPLSVEFEYNWDNNQAEITQCVDFVKASKN